MCIPTSSFFHARQYVAWKKRGELDCSAPEMSRIEGVRFDYDINVLCDGHQFDGDVPIDGRRARLMHAQWRRVGTTHIHSEGRNLGEKGCALFRRIVQFVHPK